MELNVTRFLAEAGMIDYSASRAEIGQDAGRVTWQAACDDSAYFPLLQTDEAREAFRAHVRDFGAWDDEEIAAWSDVELNALCMQMIAGDAREGGLDTDAPDWDRYRIDSESGRVSGRLFRADDGQVYYYVGN